MKADLTDRVFGRLVVVDPSHHDDGGHLHWLCLCECGTTITTDARSLTSGHTRSCGCLRADTIGNLRRGQRVPINVGARYGMLTIICGAGDDPMGRAIVYARCDCGNVSFPRWD